MRATFNAYFVTLRNTLETLRDKGAIHSMLWRNAIDEYLNGAYGELEENTIRGYRWHLYALSDWACYAGITLEDFRGRNMRSFISQRAQEGGRSGKGRSDKTLREDCISAKSFFNYCVRHRILESNPLHDYEFPKGSLGYVKMPSSDELRRLLKAVDDSWNPKVNPRAQYARKNERKFFASRDYAILACLIETGTRVGDVLTLKLSDYVPSEQLLRIRDPKDDEPRDVPITNKLTEVLTAWKKVRPGCDSDLLFITQFGEGIKVNAFGKSFRRYREYAGLEGFSLHGIKHYVVTVLTESHDISTASQITGTSISTLAKHYNHRVTDTLRAKHAAANLLGRVLVNKRTRQKVIRP